MAIGVASMRRHGLEKKPAKREESQAEPKDFAFLEQALEVATKIFSGDLAGVEENVILINDPMLYSLAAVATCVGFDRAGQSDRALQVVRNLQCYRPLWAIHAILRLKEPEVDYARQMAERIVDRKSRSCALRDINLYERARHRVVYPKGGSKEKVERLLSKVASIVKRLGEIDYSSDFSTLSLQLSAYASLIRVFNELVK